MSRSKSNPNGAWWRKLSLAGLLADTLGAAAPVATPPHPGDLTANISFAVVETVETTTVKVAAPDGTPLASIESTEVTTGITDIAITAPAPSPEPKTRVARDGRVFINEDGHADNGWCLGRVHKAGNKAWDADPTKGPSSTQHPTRKAAVTALWQSHVQA